MATNKKPSTEDLEEGSQERNATSNEPNILLWPSSDKYMHRCIYRVPCWLKRVKPEAYTPQMLLIGPLHQSTKALAVELSKTDCRYLVYLKMERHKEKYLKNFADKFGEETVDEFRRIIKKYEEIIRACYAESTDSIISDDFVEMTLLDSVFILVFFLQCGVSYMHKTGDFVLDEPCYNRFIFEDLILLENQLPYSLLETLFEPFFRNVGVNGTFRNLILEYFGLKGKIKEEVKFLHFTDMFRRGHVQTLGITEEQENIESRSKRNVIKNLHNTDKLDSAGIQFVADKSDNSDEGNLGLSLKITFERGILKMPCFIVLYNTESYLRNIMALEQCHYTYTAYVCEYISFLNFLIDTEQDVELLIRKEVVKNRGNSAESVAQKVNKLCVGIVNPGSHYYDIAERLNKHYESHLNRTLATLRRVYFKDLWTGTATVTAVVIVVLTLIGTVASVLQVTQKDN